MHKVPYDIIKVKAGKLNICNSLLNDESQFKQSTFLNFVLIKNVIKVFTHSSHIVSLSKHGTRNSDAAAIVRTGSTVVTFRRLLLPVLKSFVKISVRST